MRLTSAIVAVVCLLGLASGAQAQQNLAQIPMAGSTIPQWVHPLPMPGPSGIPVVDGTAPITLNVCEFQAQVLPPPMPPTWVWGYIQGESCPAPGTIRPTYLGPIVVAQRNVPTPVTFFNRLGTAASTNVLAYKYSLDQTIHWADPLGTVSGIPEMNWCAMNPPAPGSGPAPGSPCALTYAGPIPATPHLHGGEVPPELDGGPSSWFTNDLPGFEAIHAGNYYSSVAGQTNAATYNYPNRQEASPIWFHDHTLGATRLNVYAGIAGGYFVTDPGLSLPPTLPGVGETIPVILQDRMFDTNGQLFYPADSAAGVLWALNPEHPYWVPEFVGDAIVVNGKAWPFHNVEPKRYRFLFLNGSNARTYDLSLPPGVPMYVIGNDGGYLDQAAPIGNLVIMPGERYELIVDFTGLKPGKSVILRNSARTPYPGGTPPRGTTVGQVLKFNVVPCTGTNCGAADTTFNPAVSQTLRITQPMTRLVDAATGAPATGVDVDLRRQLTLNEVMGMPPRTAIDPVTGQPTRFPGGPLEILVNNTKYSGENMMAPRPYDDFKAIPTTPMETLVSELPQEGATEEWEIINLTADAHPIHLHLVQFQILNRQAFDLKGYLAAYGLAFPGVAGNPMCPAGLYCPAFGPPLDYNQPNADGAVGGNPSPAAFLKGAPVPPSAQETGWKDTMMAPPGTITRMIVRWSPTSASLGATGQAAAYPFDPSGRIEDGTEEGTDKYGYVWHCHIIDHEDNEMMRPDYVTPLPSVTRDYVKGRDY
ncbi:MAG: multicopper oxidase domain-containing protein [Myxococcales bacterium]